jgi:hypothetical protein
MQWTQRRLNQYSLAWMKWLQNQGFGSIEGAEMQKSFGLKSD